ncbi:MAG: hypothetical protein JO060_03095 [Candidatus Eremiobacteraeota bacterium]|nr:hypothetical protein [Candidatus Eremiobacteraeota bacterium]MBV9647947.1 hypothetical protein [Candidatus Eremiobacteraeota bacterium]
MIELFPPAQTRKRFGREALTWLALVVVLVGGTRAASASALRGTVMPLPTQRSAVGTAVHKDAGHTIKVHALPGVKGGLEFTIGADGNFWVGDDPDNAVLKVSPKGKLLKKIVFPESNAGILAVANGSDGNEWIVERNTGNIYKITPKGKTTLYSGVIASGCLALFDTPGPDGNVWFTTDFCGLGKVTPSGVVTMCTFPNYGDQILAVVAGADGNMWYNLGFNGSPGYIGAVSTSCATGPQYEYASSTGGGIGLTVGPDSKLWFTASAPGEIGKVSTTGGLAVYPQSATMGGIVSGPNGDLYFAQANPDAIGRITTNGKVTLFTNGMPSGCYPQWVVIGSDKKVWFTCSNLGAMGEVAP